jgi:hypothetical protein
MVLLLIGAALMAWKGWATWGASTPAGPSPGEAPWLRRIALMELLLAGLALAAALTAGLALRRRRARRRLGLQPTERHPQ